MVVAQEKTGCYRSSSKAPRPKNERRSGSVSRGPRLVLTGLVLAIFLVGVSITYYYSQVFSLGYKIGRLEKELAYLRVENYSLDGEIRRLSSLERVESLAILKLGMVKPDGNDVLVVAVSDTAGQPSAPPAEARMIAGAFPAGEDKSRLIRAFTELVDRLEDKIRLGSGAGAGSEGEKNANNEYLDPEKNNRNLSLGGPGAPWADLSPGLASACGRG